MTPAKHEMPEEWKPVCGYEGRYEVSSLGRIKSLKREIICSLGRKQTPPERIMSLSDDGNGYLKFLLCKEGKIKVSKVHRVVVEAFIGPIEKGRVVNHKDGNPKNNCVDNLEIVSIRENSTHGKSGKKMFTGSCQHKKTGLWAANISINGKRKNLGYFPTEELASLAYKEALVKFNLENKYVR